MRPLPGADDPRVRALPEDLRPLVLAAIGHMPAYYADRRDAWKRKCDLWNAVLEAAGFAHTADPHADIYQRHVLAPSQYTERQNAVATLIADVPAVDPYEFPLYMRAWVQRQLLGLEPRGILFDPVGEQTLFDHFRLLMATDKPASLAWVSALPVPRRLEVIGELMLAGDCSDYELSSLLPVLWADLRDEGRAWAPAYADRLLTFFEDSRGGEIYTANGPALRATLAITVLLALVRANIAIEPRWDTLFVMWDVDVDTVPWEIVEALPEERRPLAVRRIAEGGDRNRLKRWGPVLLQRYPFETVAEYLLFRISDMDKPRDFLKEMKVLAKAHVGIGRALAAYEAANPKVAKLTFVDREPVTKLADLDDVARAQLVEANRRYGGILSTAEAIMQNSGEEEPEGGPQIETSHLSRARVLGPRKVHLYDAYFYNVDSGTFFEKGSVKVVAELVQDSVESTDKALAQALAQALST